MTPHAASVWSASGSVGARVLVIAAGLIVSIITARYLGPEGRGQYFAITTAAALVAQFGNLGLSSSNTFMVARDPAVAWPLTVNSLCVVAVIGLAAIGATIAFADPLSRRLGLPQALLWCICVIGPASLFFTLGGSILIGLDRFLALNVWQVVSALVVLVALGVCVALDTGLAGFAVAAAGSALAVAVALLAHLSGGRRNSIRFRADLFRSGLGYAFKAYVALLLAFLLQRLGVAFLTWYQQPAEIGQFSIALQVHDVLLIVPGAIGMVLLPKLIRQRSRGPASPRGALTLTVAMMVAACGVVAAVGRALIPFVFGESFALAYEVMLWLLPAVLFTSVTTVLSQFIVAEGFPVALVAVWLCGLVVAGVAAAILVRDHGAIGVSAAQSIGALVVCSGTVALARKRRRPGQVESAVES